MGFFVNPLTNAKFTRRIFPGSLFILLAAAEDHFPFGPMGTPRVLPPWVVLRDDGKSAAMDGLTKGHVTAIQLMFTSCRATCPLQGAAFARARKELGGAIPDARFVSISVDPGTDTPAAMSLWLKQFKANSGPGSEWIGLTPRKQDVPEMFRVLGDGGVPRPSGPDPHSGQVYIVSRDGKLVYRTPSMPSGRQIVDAMMSVSALRPGRL